MVARFPASCWSDGTRAYSLGTAACAGPSEPLTELLTSKLCAKPPHPRRALVLERRSSEAGRCEGSCHQLWRRGVRRGRAVTREPLLGTFLPISFVSSDTRVLYDRMKVSKLNLLIFLSPSAYTSKAKLRLPASRDEPLYINSSPPPALVMSPPSLAASSRPPVAIHIAHAGTYIEVASRLMVLRVHAHVSHSQRIIREPRDFSRPSRIDSV